MIPPYTEFHKKVVKDEDRLYARYLARPISTRISWLLLKIWPGVTPNQISVLDFFIGLAAIVQLFLSNRIEVLFFSILLLFIWSILDHVDGEIARFKEMRTPSGFFLEITFDYIIVALIPLSISYYLFKNNFGSTVLVVGIVDCFFIILCALTLANNNWAIYKFIPNNANGGLLSAEPQLRAKLGGKNSVARFIIPVAKSISKIGSFLIFSGYILLMLSIFTLLDMGLMSFSYHTFLMLHLFVYIFLYLIIYFIFLLVSEYFTLKVRFEWLE